MSSYGTELDTADSSFDDPTAELEANAEADDPEGDLGDGADPRARRRTAFDNIDPARLRKLHEKRGI